jgi:hypothetical protein
MVGCDGMAKTNARCATWGGRGGGRGWGGRGRWRWSGALSAVRSWMEGGIENRRARLAHSAIRHFEAIAHLPWDAVGCSVEAAKRAVWLERHPPHIPRTTVSKWSRRRRPRQHVLHPTGDVRDQLPQSLGGVLALLGYLPPPVLPLRPFTRVETGARLG